MSWEIKILGRSSQYLNFLSRITRTSYLLIDNGLGAGEDIDRFSMPHGICTPRIRDIRVAEFSEYGIDHSIEISPYVAGFTRLGISRRNHLGFQTFQQVQTCCGLRNDDAKFGDKIWSNECKNADRMNICFMAGPARSCLAFTLQIGGWVVWLNLDLFTVDCWCLGRVPR